MEIKEILQDNINSENKGKPMFMDVDSSMCDPVFGKNEHKYALFSYVPNNIQFRKNKDFIVMLNEKGKIDNITRDALIKLFCGNKQLFQGVGRIRGSFSDVDSATRRAEHIVQHVDPFTSVMVCAIGVPFPLVESGFAASTKLVDKNAVDAVLKDDISIKKTEREKAVKEMKARERKLAEESTNPHKTPLDNYIELRVKYAQVKHTMNEMKKKLSEYSDIVDRTVVKIQSIEEESPELKDVYFNAYMDACKEVGVTPPDGFLLLLKEQL